MREDEIEQYVECKVRLKGGGGKEREGGGCNIYCGKGHRAYGLGI